MVLLKRTKLGANQRQISGVTKDIYAIVKNMKDFRFYTRIIVAN